MARKTIGTIESRYPGAILIDDKPERQLVKIVFEGNEFWTLRHCTAKFRVPRRTTKKVIDTEEITELEIGRNPEPILEAGLDDVECGITEEDFARAGVAEQEAYA